ncbi:MAG: methyl-accepting chemotaxis protein [Thermodesulforhabdaceae bacterium]
MFRTRFSIVRYFKNLIVFLNMKKIMKKSIELVDLALLINKESEVLNDGTEELASEVSKVSIEMDLLSETVKKISYFAKENVERVGIVYENIDHTKKSLDNTEKSMLSVKEAVNELIAATNEISKAINIISSLTTTIKGIADKTKLLSLNATIEAARAGQHGACFAVVAQEIGALAQATMETTKDVNLKTKIIFDLIEKIKGSTLNINNHVQNTYKLVCLNKEKIKNVDKPIKELALSAESLNGISSDLENTVNTLDHTMATLSEFVNVTASSSSTLKEYAEILRSLSDEQILAVGKARIDIHDYAKELIERVSSSWELRSMHKATIENYLRRLIKQYDIFELLYVTDESGVQIIDNISREDFRAAYGSTGYGKDWSDRVWFRKAKDTLSTYVSDIYISAATNSYCFTVSCPILDDEGKMIGVLGADLELGRIINE